jgi:hypothetical protein
MPKTEELTTHEKQVFAAEQKAARLRAEADRAERILAELQVGEVKKPQVKHYTFSFNEPLCTLALSLTDTQTDLLTSIFKANGIHGSMRVRNAEKVANDG